MTKIVIYHGQYTKGFYEPEATRGANPGGTFNWIGIVQRFNKRINPNLIPVRGTGSDKVQHHPPGRAEFDFGVEYSVQDPGLIGEMLIPTAAGKSSTVEIRDSGDGVTYKYWLYTGLILDNLSITSRVGEVLTARMTGGSMDLTVTGSSGIGTDPTGPPAGTKFKSSNEPALWHDGSVKVGASDAPEIIEYNLNVSHSATRRYGFSNNKPRDNIPNEFKASGTLIFTTEYGSGDYIGDIIAGTKQDLVFYLYSTTDYITVSNAKFARLDNPSEANTVLTETFAFEGEDAVLTP